MATLTEGRAVGVKRKRKSSLNGHHTAFHGCWPLETQRAEKDRQSDFFEGRLEMNVPSAG